MGHLSSNNFLVRSKSFCKSNTKVTSLKRSISWASKSKKEGVLRGRPKNSEGNNCSCLLEGFNHKSNSKISR